MRKLLLLILLMSPSLALAGGGYSKSQANAMSTNHTKSTANSQQQQAQQQAQQQQQRAEQANVQTANSAAMGGTLNIEGGAFEQGDNSIDIDASTQHKRNAPAVTVMPSPTTAEMMVCFGRGGSATNGAATGAWCRLQKELYAEHMGLTLANMRLYQDAAKAYCGRKMHWRVFGTRGTCIDRMVAGYRVQFPPIVKITGPPIPVEPPKCDDSKLKRCEDELAGRK